jgi:hypothetical protein
MTTLTDTQAGDLEKLADTLEEMRAVLAFQESISLPDLRQVVNLVR